MPNRPDSPAIAAVLLAAGPSTRLGQAKQLVRVGGESLVRRMSRLLLRINPSSLTVVTGCHSDEVQREVQDLPLKISLNESWELGMGGSIACGVRNSPQDVDGILIVACDLWKLGEADLLGLIKAWNSDISEIISASWFQKNTRVYGPPALFPRKYIRELNNLKGKQGAKAIIARNPAGVRFFEMENAAFDLDTAEDLAQLVERR